MSMRTPVSLLACAAISALAIWAAPAAVAQADKGKELFVMCATAYNDGRLKEAVPLCDKAIAADPKRADTYFVKGSALMGLGEMDKAGKFKVPAGTVEALKKYLEVAPAGGHAADVKEMLQALGQK